MAISCARHRKSVFMISANAFFALSFSVGKVKAIKFLIWKILSASWTLRQPEKGVAVEYFASFKIDARAQDGRHEIIGLGLKTIIF